jgi:hypothetical protein
MAACVAAQKLEKRLDNARRTAWMVAYENEDGQDKIYKYIWADKLNMIWTWRWAGTEGEEDGSLYQRTGTNNTRTGAK